MKNRILLILIFSLLINNLILPQCEEPQAIFRFNQNTNRAEGIWDWNDPDVIYWGLFVQSFGMHIAYFDMTTLPINLLNNQAEITNQTVDCINQWNSGGCLNLLYDDSFPYVRLEFSNDVTLFPSTTEYAGTVFNVSGNPGDWQFEYINGSYGSPQTKIAFNKTDQFLNLYTWSIETTNPGADYVPFKPILLHELGHIIGLEHNGSTGIYVMSFPFIHNQFIFQLTDCDRLWRTELCLFNGQNPATALEISPLNKFVNSQHSFFEYSPEILIYSEKKNDRTEED